MKTKLIFQEEKNCEGSCDQVHSRVNLSQFNPCQAYLNLIHIKFNLIHYKAVTYSIHNKIHQNNLPICTSISDNQFKSTTEQPYKINTKIILIHTKTNQTQTNLAETYCTSFQPILQTNSEMDSNSSNSNSILLLFFYTTVNIFDVQD